MGPQKTKQLLHSKGLLHQVKKRPRQGGAHQYCEASFVCLCGLTVSSIISLKLEGRKVHHAVTTLCSSIHSTSVVQQEKIRTSDRAVSRMHKELKRQQEIKPPNQ